MFSCYSLLNFLLISCSLFIVISPETASTVNADQLETCEPQVLSSKKRILMDSKYSTGLDLFVCPGMSIHPRHIFVDVQLKLNLTDPATFQLYQGPNCTSVQDAYDSDHRLFGLLKSVNLWRSMQLDPFSRTIIGIATTEKYEIGLVVYSISAWRLVLFSSAILLYLFAPWLVRNVIVFYATGCTGGALLSALLLVFLLYRVAPKKTIGIPILLGGWSAAAWMAVHAWNNFSSIMMQYQRYLAVYFVTAMILSFAYCYKQGPPTNDRSLDLATWLFQFIACLLIYFASQVPVISYTVIALLILSSLLLSDTSKGAFSLIANVWLYFFPRPRRLLTEEEYEKEAAEYTKQELTRLREYCRSPEANSWKMTSKIKTPQRFARFVEGEDGHVSLREEREHLAFSLDGDDFYEPDEEERADETTDDDEGAILEYERWKEMEEEEKKERWRRSMRRSQGGNSSRLGELRDRGSANTSRSFHSSPRPPTLPRPSRAAASTSAVVRPILRDGTAAVAAVGGVSSVTPRSSRKPSAAAAARLPPPHATSRDYYSSDEDDNGGSSSSSHRR